MLCLREFFPEQVRKFQTQNTRDAIYDEQERSYCG